MEYILTAKSLRFLDIIQYPDISFKEKTFTFITGESGCGKSTLLKLLNATLLPQQGQIFYRNHDISQENILEYRRKVLLVPQEVFLFEDSVKENFRIFYSMREQAIPSDETIKHFLHICHADFAIDNSCTTLSGGERQRVFLALFLSFLPDVLLLDEPTAALDENTSVILLTNIKSFCEENGITPICVCHNPELVQKFAQEVICLNKGA